MRLVLLLMVLVVSLLITRAFLVALANADRVPGESMEGLQFDGRYYPIERTCPRISKPDLEAGLAGHRLSRQGLVFLGNVFDQHVGGSGQLARCTLANQQHERNTRVTIGITASVYTTPELIPDVCGPEVRTGTALEIDTGRVHGCQSVDRPDEVIIFLIDDNATLHCHATVRESELLPALADAMRPVCERHFDALADSRPVGFWGAHGSFWTWR